MYHVKKSKLSFRIYHYSTKAASNHRKSCVKGLPFSMYAGGGGSSLPYISIAYYMQKGEEGVQIACKIAHLLNGTPLSLKTGRTLY